MAVSLGSMLIPYAGKNLSI